MTRFDDEPKRYKKSNRKHWSISLSIDIDSITLPNDRDGVKDYITTTSPLLSGHFRPWSALIMIQPSSQSVDQRSVNPHWCSGYNAARFAECALQTGARANQDWMDGFVTRHSEMGLIPEDASLYIQGRIGYLIGLDVVDNRPEGEEMYSQWVHGWLSQQAITPRKSPLFHTEFESELDWRFGSDDVFGITCSVVINGQALPDMSASEYDTWCSTVPQDQLERAHVLIAFPDGGVTNCTNYARSVRKTLIAEGHDVQIVGFKNENNPDCAVTKEDLHPGGHDFAIVDGRYLVDPWIRLVAMARNRIVYDLGERYSLEAAVRVYGTPSLWESLDRLGETGEGIISRHLTSTSPSREVIPLVKPNWEVA